MLLTFKNLNKLILITTLLCVKTISSENSPIKHITTSEIKKLTAIKSVWFFFKPNCPSCLLQVKNFSCLKDTQNIYSVGLSGSDKELWIESKKLQLKKHGIKHIYRGNKSLYDTFSIDENLSPQILFYENKTKIKKFIGVLPCQEILAFIN